MSVCLQEVVNRHISKLQSQVGLKSGTVQEISVKHLQVRSVRSQLFWSDLIKFHRLKK